MSYLPGTHGTFEAQTTANLRSGDPIPVAPAVTGEEGWTFSGWSPVPINIVLGNAVYIAQWTNDSEPDAPPVTTVPGGNTPTADVIEPPATPEEPTPTEQITNAAIEEGIPVLNIFGLPVPLVTPSGFYAWSLADLILTVFGVLVFALLGIRTILKKRNDKKYEGAEANERQKKVDMLLFLVSLIAAIAAIVLFLLTQDMSLPLVLFDRWTIAFATLFIISFVSSILAVEKVRVKDEEEHEEDIALSYI